MCRRKHTELSVPDFIEQQEMDDYYNRRAEEKMRLFVTAMASLTEKQHKYLVMRYVDGISARDIAKADSKISDKRVGVMFQGNDKESGMESC